MRVFALAILVIIAGCVINSIKAYKQYLDISDMSDIIAFNSSDSSTYYVLNYADKESRDEYYYTQYSGENGNIYTRDSLKAKIRSKTYLSDYNKEMYDNSNEMFTEVDTKGETRRYFNRFSSYTLMCNIKKADTPVYKDIDKNMIDYINSIDGVEDISYGYFETARTWAWNNTSLVCHGIFNITLTVLKHLMIIKKRINIFLQQNMWKMIINYMTY